MESYEEKLAKLDEKQRQIEARKKKLIQQHKEKERKERTRRLIQKGALSETYFNCEKLTEEETKKLFIKISQLNEVKNILPVYNNPEEPITIKEE